MIVGKVKYLERSDDKKSLFSSSTKSNFIDNEIFEIALEDSNSIKNKIYKNEETTPFFNQLSKDLFNSLYKVSPEVYHKENVYSSLNIENDILKEITNNEKFEEIRENTSGDMFGSTLALGLFQDKAKLIIEEWEKENKETMDKINDAIRKQNELDDLMEQLEDIDDLDENESFAKTLQKNIKELKKDIEAANELIDSDLQSPSGIGDLCNNLKGSLNSVGSRVKSSSDAMDNLGLSTKGGRGECKNACYSTTKFEDKIKIVDSLSESSIFRETINNLGRIKESLGKINKKPSKHGQIICDIGNGNNIKRVLSTEKVKLFDNELENDFYKRYSEKTLLEYKTVGFEDVKGPIVVCLDLSGSMSFGGQPNESWAKAVAIATLQLAVKQKRNYRCILFSDYIIDIIDVDKGEMDVDKMTKIMNTKPGGGTSFKEPLQVALQSIEESKFKKADILFLTDGSPYNMLPSDFKSRFIATKKNKGFKVQSILIGATDTKFLREFSDDITLIESLYDTNKNANLSKIFNKMKDD